MKTVKYWIKLRWLTLQWQQVRSPPGSPYSTPPETPRWEMVESLRRCRPWGPSSSPGPQHDPETQPLFINHIINMADYTMSSGGLVCNPPLCICQDSDLVQCCQIFGIFRYIRGSCGLYLGCFGRTHHPPQCVVQLSGFCQFAVSANRRVDATEVGQSGSEGQTVQHLQAEK